MTHDPDRIAQALVDSWWMGSKVKLRERIAAAVREAEERGEHRGVTRRDNEWITALTARGLQPSISGILNIVEVTIQPNRGHILTDDGRVLPGEWRDVECEHDDGSHTVVAFIVHKQAAAPERVTIDDCPHLQSFLDLDAPHPNTPEWFNALRRELWTLLGERGVGR